MVSSESPSRIHPIERRFRAMLNPSTTCGPLPPMPPKAKLIVSLLASCLLLPLAVLLGAQNASTKLTGTVFDISGAAVPNATITVTNNKAETIEMTTSGAHGNFDFAALAAGEYELKIVKPGFEEYKAPRIIMTPGRESSQNITLQPGAYMEEVNVVAKGAAKPQPTETAGKPTRVRLGGEIKAPSSRFRRQAGDRSHCRDESGDHTPVSPRRARQFVRDLEEGSGQQVYAPHYRAEWLAKISEAGVRRRAELYYVQFDTLAALRQGVRRELLAESRKHPATKLRRQIPL